MKALLNWLYHSKLWWIFVVLCAFCLTVYTCTAYAAEYLQESNSWVLEENEFVITEEEAREALVAVGERDELEVAIEKLRAIHDGTLEEYRSASGYILILEEDRTRLLGSVEFWGKVAGIAIGVGLAGWAAFVISLVL